MNTRRKLLVVIGTSALTAPFGSFAQRQGKVPKIGFLFAGTLAKRPQADEFFQGLKALGYIEGQTITIERREAEGKTERLPQLARELVALQPDLMVTATTSAAAAGQKATQTIPIVMLIVGDPVGSGFAKTLARPGGNMTGPAINMAELNLKRIQLLKELLPSASRVTFLWNSQNTPQASTQKALENAARALGLIVESLGFTGPNDLEPTLTKAARAKVLLVAADPVTFDQRELIARFAVAHQIAAIGTFPEEAQDGALLAYGANLGAAYRRGAAYVDKLLRGAKPADLPIEDPLSYELVVNLKTAKALGIKIPDSIMLRADKVIE